MAEPVAAIDCGTNTVRLLVTDGERELERTHDITRLGQGVDRTGRLDEAAIGRTLAVLAGHRRLLDRHGVTSVRMAATSAARNAANRDDFFAEVQAVLGVAPDLIGGEEEGRLAFLGATADLDPARGPFCVIDIGGGSTEIAVGGSELEHVMSVDMGSVRFTERYIDSDPPEPEELLACISVAESHLADVIREVPGLGEVGTFVGVAGTVTTVAAVEIGLATYDPALVHHFELTHDAAEDVFRTLATESLADRVYNPGLHPDRAEVIVAGTAILVATMRTLGIDPLVVSEHDLLDGIAASLLS